MLFRYTGQLADHVSYQEKTIYLNPDSEVNLDDDLTEFPYIARLIQNGILKAVSRPKQEEETPEEITPELAGSESAAVAPEPATITPEPAPVAVSAAAPAKQTEDVK